MGVRALGAFSGGLDGMLAALLLKSQGVEVELATFSSPFFESKPGRDGASELGIPWRDIPFTEEILNLLNNPPSGFGKNLNPCIDCHAAMFRILGEIAVTDNFDFIFTGEVAGQRPMSQNKNSLNRVARLSGYGDILLRPLSARLLRITAPERDGQVDREKLLRFSGRGRIPQMKLAREYGIRYSNPAGGCLLTDPNYCGRLKNLMEIPRMLNGRNAGLIKHGRFFRLSSDTIGLVGRSEKDNAGLEALIRDEICFKLDNIPGPTGVLIGSPEMLPELIALVKRYAGDKSVN